MEIKEISDISYLLPPMTTETDSTDSTEDSDLYMDYIIFSMEYTRAMQKEEYVQAAEFATQLIELAKEHPFRYGSLNDQFIMMRAQRAHAYVMAKDYDAASNDLQWIDQHAPVFAGNQVQVFEGVIQLLQGKEATLLQKQAAKGNRLAMLIANTPENLEPPKTEWLMLPREERIQKLVEGRHYGLVIEEIEKMDIESYMWCNTTSDQDWIALRGACYALRGNFVQAINSFKDQEYSHEYNKELAIVYAMAGQKERALKALDKQRQPDIQSALIQQWIESKN